LFSIIILFFNILYLFWINNLHFTFYLSFLGMNYCNVIGFQIFMVFLLQFFSGLLLSSYYSPFIAFNSISVIMIKVNVGWFIRFFHIFGSSLFMIFIKFHWIRGIWLRLKMIEQIEIGSLIKENKFCCSFYFVVPLLFCCSYLFVFSLIDLIYLDSLNLLFLCFPQLFVFFNLSLNGVGNLVFDNSLINFIIFFFIVGMININLLFLY
jgi:hypothetical protein